MSSGGNEFHKKTKRVNECEITKIGDDETDPVIKNLSRIGCLEKHYQVQDCYFESKDWRKCTKEVQEFRECIKKSQQSKV